MSDQVLEADVQEIDYLDSSYGLELALNQINTGGVSGVAVTVAIRKAGTTGTYLDWNDNTFKAAGWVTKNEPMTDIGNGCYQAQLNVKAMGFTTAQLPVKLVAEYTSPSSGNTTGGFTVETLVVSELRPDAKTARQFQTNRLEAAAGNPGILTLYDDDKTTVLSTQNLNDAGGGAVTAATGVPAKRSST